MLEETKHNSIVYDDHLPIWPLTNSSDTVCGEWYEWYKITQASLQQYIYLLWQLQVKIT